MSDVLRTFIGCRISVDSTPASHKVETATGLPTAAAEAASAGTAPAGILSVLDDLEVRHPEFRQVPVQNLHVTVCFLGELPAAVVADFADCLTEEVSGLPEFEAMVGTPGGFPHAMRSSIVWLSVSPVARLTELHAASVEVADLLGVNTEDRPFHPHLTIGRLPRPRRSRSRRRRTSTPAPVDIRDFIDAWRDRPIAVQAVQTLTVFTSTLAAGGSIYQTYRDIPLAGEN